MKTAACCRIANSSSTDIPSRFVGVEENLSAENIQLNLAFGNAGADVFDVVVGVVVDDDACIFLVFVL